MGTMTRPKGKLQPLTSFYEMLQESVRGYEGRHSEIIKHTPEMFKLFTNLLEDPMVPPASKPIINATISYFVAPFDALPEEVYGPVGFLDDLYLSVWSIKRLEEQLGYPILDNNWEGEGELRDVVDEVYKKSKTVIKDLENKILDYVGLV